MLTSGGPGALPTALLLPPFPAHRRARGVQKTRLLPPASEEMLDMFTERLFSLHVLGLKEGDVQENVQGLKRHKVGCKGILSLGDL